MPNDYKPSGAKATGLLSGHFRTARLRLTVIYVAILATILFISSGVIYSAFASRLENRFHAYQPNPSFIFQPGAMPPRQQDLLRDLVYSLILVNGLLLVAAGSASYLLAGITLEPIQEAYEKQKRFLGDASHELRTPLAILHMDLENRMAAPDATEESKTQARSNLEEVERMSDIVSGLLTLSRLDDAQASDTVEMKKIDLREVVDEVVGRFAGLAREQGVAISVETPSATDLNVMVDKALLVQALENVVKNAITYNKPDGSATVSFARNDGQISLTVADTGMGIAPDDVLRVFDRFYRTDKSRSRKTGGSGLGLSIVRSAMHRMGGDVDIESEIGQWTKVTLTLEAA